MRYDLPSQVSTSQTTEPLLPPATSLVPSCPTNRTLFATFPKPELVRALTRSPVPVSQSVTTPSTCAMASKLPSGEKAASLASFPRYENADRHCHAPSGILILVLGLFSSSSLCTQSLIDPSRAVVTSVGVESPAFENARLVTREVPCGWSIRVLSAYPVLLPRPRSQNFRCDSLA